MKKIFFIAILCLFSFIGKGQVTVSDLFNVLKEGNASKAKELADKAIQQTVTDPGIWYYRGQIYLAIFGSPDKSVQQMSEDALEQSYKAFLKVLELDKQKKYNKETIEALQSIATQFNYEGVNNFNQKRFEKSLEYFENAISINKLPAINKIDTIAYYNAALASEKCKKIDKAVFYYEELKRMKFGGSHIYIELAKLYLDNQQESKGIEVFKQGLTVFTNEKPTFYNEMINYYIKTNKPAEVLKYIDEALPYDSKNPALYFIKGSILEQAGKEKEAEQLYLKTLELNPNYQDALFNLGAMYYNKATALIKKAMNKSEQNQAIEIYKQAQPYLETYTNEYEKEETVLKMLKTIYTLTNQNDKLNQVNQWLQK